MKKLGIRGPKTHLTMNFAGGQKKSEASEFLDITVVSNTELSIQNSMRTYAIKKTCRPSRTVSRTTLPSYHHLKSISEQLHLSGGTVYLVIRRDFDDASNDVHVIAGSPEHQLQREIASGGTSCEHLLQSRVNVPRLSVQLM